MATQKDDWEKPRGRAGHLTAKEIEIVRQGYRARRGIRDVARELKCASRTISKYYGFFRVSGEREGSEVPTMSATRKPRFYRSSFDPA